MATYTDQTGKKTNFKSNDMLKGVSAEMMAAVMPAGIGLEQMLFVTAGKDPTFLLPLTKLQMQIDELKEQVDLVSDTCADIDPSGKSLADFSQQIRTCLLMVNKTIEKLDIDNLKKKFREIQEYKRKRF